MKTVGVACCLIILAMSGNSRVGGRNADNVNSRKNGASFGTTPGVPHNDNNKSDPTISFDPSLPNDDKSPGTTCEEAETKYPLEPWKLGFYLYTRKLLLPYHINPKNISAIPFVPNATTLFILHGYCSNKDNSPNPEVRPALLQRGNFNVISIDWSYYAKKGCYYEATKSVIQVGNNTAYFINDITTKRNDIKFEDVHVIGHSLGAQTAARVGKCTKSEFGRNISRISGLDPAQPGYSKYFFDGFTINKTDANQVDVIHTNAGEAGKPEDCGTVDFFLNGGANQPGCPPHDKVCNHLRACDYFGESINEPHFWGYPCTHEKYSQHLCNVAVDADYVPMGFNTDPNITGQYYVDTYAKKLYSKGKCQDATPLAPITRCAGDKDN